MHLVNPPPDSLYPGLHLEQRRSNLTIAPPLAPASRNRLLSNTRPAQHKRGDRVCLGGREKKKSFATFFGGESREGRKRERAPLSPQPSRARAFSVAGSARGIKLRALYLSCRSSVVLPCLVACRVSLGAVSRVRSARFGEG